MSVLLSSELEYCDYAPSQQALRIRIVGTSSREGGTNSDQKPGNQVLQEVWELSMYSHDKTRLKTDKIHTSTIKKKKTTENFGFFFVIPKNWIQHQ